MRCGPDRLGDNAIEHDLQSAYGIRVGTGRDELDVVLPQLMIERVRRGSESRAEDVALGPVLAVSEYRPHMMREPVEVVVAEGVPDEEHVAGEEHRLH